MPLASVITFLCWVFLHLEVTQATNPCPSPPCLFYTDTTAVKAFRLQGHRSSVSTVKSNLRRAAAIAVDVRRKLLFWSDLSRDVIQSLNFTSGRVQDVVTKDIANVRGMAVDWETGLVYWTDYGRREVSVVTYDGMKRKTLVNVGVVNPHGIAVDPRNGIMFWTDLGTRSRIQKATLSGHDQTTIVNLNPLSQHWPHGITIDYTNNRLYWIDSMQDQIMSVDFNGKNRVLHRSFHFNIRAFSLDMLGELLYWSDSMRYTTKIRTINKNHGNTGVYYNVGYSSVMGIAIYDQSRQPRGNTSCVKGNNDCQYLCLLSPRGPNCACPNTQILNEDGTTCRESTKSILLTTSFPASIYQIPLDAPQPEMKPVSLANLVHPNAIDVDPIDRRVYWADSWQRSIFRASLNGTSKERIVGMVRNPEGLAVDWVAGNLYWTDMIANRIEVAKLDGKYKKTLIYKNLERPTQIVLDVKKRYLYWGSGGVNLPPKIEQADTTGLNRRVLANLASRSLRGITIFENRLYWIDEFHNVLQYVDRVSPAGVVTIHLPGQLLQPSVLTSLNGALYLLDTGRRANDGAVVKIDKNTGRVLQNLTWFLNRPLGIVAVNFNATLTPNACSQNNGNCSHLCLLEPSGRKCACPNGMTLKDDGRTCYFKEFLLYADAGGFRRRGIYRLSLDNAANTPVKLSLSNIRQPTALDFDPIEAFLYWSDVNLVWITRAHLNGSSQINVISSGLGNPQGLAVDVIGRNLYWTDMVRNVIEVSKLNGSYKKVLLSNLDQPKAIVLDGKRGFMYWSSWGQLAKIERADMNGANRTLIQSFPNHWTDAPPSPNGLALDPETNLLYWIDELKGTLKFIDLKTQPYRVQNIISSHLYLGTPFGLVLNEENIFWSEQGRGGGIFSIAKRHGSVVKRVARTSSNPRDVHVYHNATAIPDSHPCTIYNGWCTHLCLIVPGGYKCACPTITKPGPPCLTVPNRPNATSSPITTTSIPATMTSTTATTTTTPETTVQSTTEKQTTAKTYPTTTQQPTTSTTTTTTTTKQAPTTLPTTKRTTTTTSTTKEYTTITPQTTQPRQTSFIPPTKLTTSGTRNPCLSNPCRNGGKCTMTQRNQVGFVCQCKNGYASKLCDVFYGENKIEMTLEMNLEDWKTSEFKKGMAKIVNEYCKRHECGQVKYKRRRRSSFLVHFTFTPDDVIVVGNPKAVSNGIKVQTVVLEPQQENQPGPRKPMLGSLLCAIMRDSKESGSSISKGYNILALNGETEPTCTGPPIADKNRGHRSGDSSSSSVSGSAAGAAVGVLCVMALVLILFYIYRKRKQHRQEENEVRTNVTFSNPGFQNEPGVDILLSPTYEEIGPELRDEILALNNDLPWQEDFSGLTNPVCHGVEQGAACAKPRQHEQVENNKLMEELRVNIELPEDSIRDSRHGNAQSSENNGNYGNDPSNGNLGDRTSDTNDERYVTMPPGGMLNRKRQTNSHLKEEPEYASIPTGRSKPKENTQEPEYSFIPAGRSKPKIDKQEPEYDSIPAGRSKPSDAQEPKYLTLPNGRLKPNEFNTEADDIYEKMNSDEVNKPRSSVASPPEDPTLNETYVEPESLEAGQSRNQRGIYVNANEITGLPLQEDSKNGLTCVNADIVKHDEEGLGNQGDKVHEGQEITQNKDPRKGLPKRVLEVKGVNNNDETGS